MPGVWKKIGEVALSILVLVAFGSALYWLYAPADIPTKPPFAGVQLQAGVHYVTSRSWPKRTWYSMEAPLDTLRKPVALKWLVGAEGRVALSDRAPISDFPPTAPIVLLVHGYSAPEHRVATYFASFIERLRARSATEPVVIVYDWPSTARRFADLSLEERRDWIGPPVGVPGRQPVNSAASISWEADAYNWDRTAAQTAGASGLVVLLHALRAYVEPGRLSVLAHSMGSLVVLEAALRDGSSLSGLKALLLIAPDLAANDLEQAKVRETIASIGRVHVFYSHNDDVLRLSHLKSGTPRLGRDGPSATATLPGNVVLHDMTSRLGYGEAVHSTYLDANATDAVLNALQ